MGSHFFVVKIGNEGFPPKGQNAITLMALEHRGQCLNGERARVYVVCVYVVCVFVCMFVCMNLYVTV